MYKGAIKNKNHFWKFVYKKLDFVYRKGKNSHHSFFFLFKKAEKNY